MNRPPRLWRVLLRFGRHRGRRDELDADMVELFDRRVASLGVTQARRRYRRDVISVYAPQRRGDAWWTRDRPIHTGGSMFNSLLFDLRQAAHAVCRQPGFFGVAILTLAVGLGAQFSAFGVVDRLLLAPPAHVQDAGRVFRLHIERDDRRAGRFLWFQTPYPSYLHLRGNVPGIAAMAAYRNATASVGSGSEARQASVIFADHHYFPLLSVRAQLGRVFGAEDDQPPAGREVVVLSDPYWRGAFGGDPTVLGRDLRIGAKNYTVIGVMPANFTGDLPEPVDAWLPLHAGAYEMNPVWTSSFLFRSVTVLTRLAPEAQHDAAAEAVAATYRRHVEGTPAADPTARVLLSPLSPGLTQQGTLTPSARIALWIQGVAMLVCLVALANVVNLQMTRAAQQRRELAVRVALGAGRARLIVALSLEMLAVAIPAGAIAVGLAYLSAGPLQQFLLPGVPGTIDDGRLWTLAMSSVLTAAAVCVALAAMQVRLEGVSARLKTGRGGDGFSRARLRQGLLVTQVVLSALLLVGGGLFLRSVQRLGALDFGHDQDRVLVATLPMRGAGYDNEAIERFYDRALTELRSLPGVDGVAAAQSTPFAPSQSAEMFARGMDRLPFDRNGYPTFYTVTPEFFETMGMRILRGRGFTEHDRQGAHPVIVVEDALAQKLWPGQDPLGKCFALSAATAPCREVVGVVTNTRRFVATPQSALRYYVPMAQRSVAAPPQALFVRSSGDAADVITEVRQTLLRIDSNLPFVSLRPLRDLAEPEKRAWRMGTTLFVVYGAAALLVATAGVYALLNFMVAQRSREIGVRLALGASPAQTRRLIIGQSFRWIGWGLAAGIGVAVPLGRFVEPLLFETSPYDATVFAGTAVLLVVVAGAASLVPAIRASRVDPNIALRAE